MVPPQANAYHEMAITSASRERLILLAYEGVIKFLNQARMYIEQGNIPAKCERIAKAMAVIDELSRSLNREAGGEIAANLAALYEYMLRRLTLANLNSDPVVINEVLSLLQTLKSAWVTVVENPPSIAGQETPLARQVAA